MSSAATEAKEVTMLELLDRLLDRGVVLAGDITLSVADVDLVFLGLKVMLASIERADKLRWGLGIPGQHGAIDG